MKNLLPYIVLCFITSSALQAQLFVRDAYVYVADKYIYVGQDINLSTASSNIFMRNDSQILQSNATTASTNVGLGSMSIYQEGTANGFAYNYWSSPVGGAFATPGNSNFGITQLRSPTSPIASNITVPGPTIGFPTGSTGTGTFTIASRWIYTFVSSQNYSEWIFIGSASSIQPGYGFTMKGTTGTDATTGTAVAAGSATANNPGGAQRYDFRGKPNDGNIVVPLAANRKTLAGNPYPSAIDMKSFLSIGENPSCDGTAEYWEQPNGNANSHLVSSYKGGYGIYNGITNNYVPAIISSYDAAGNLTTNFATPNTVIQREFCPIGQGFLLTGLTGSVSVTFKNTHRRVIKEGVANNSQFQRLKSPKAVEDNSYGFYGDIPNVAGIDYTKISKAPTPQIILKTLIANDMVRQSSICFLDDAVDGVDRADSKSPNFEDNLPFDSYFSLNNTEFVQTTTRFDLSKKFPLGFKNTQPTVYKIKVAEIINLEAAKQVFLHDKVNDLYYDIKNNSHEFSMPAGVNNTKYEITLTNESTLTNNVNTIAGFDVFQNNWKKELTIRNPKLIDVKTCVLFDITGKMLLNKTNVGNGAEISFSTANLSEGVYIVDIITAENATVSKKIIVMNIY